MNASKLSYNELEKIKPYIKGYIEIVNKGYDFAGYKFGYELLDKQTQFKGLKKLIFCNDSVFVEPKRLDHYVKEVLSSNNDYISPVQSVQNCYHVCSWFLCFSNEIIKANFFKDYWNSYKPLHHKNYAILKGEIELSQRCIKNGYFPCAKYDTEFFMKSLSEIDYDCMKFLSKNYFYEIKKNQKNILYFERIESNHQITKNTFASLYTRHFHEANLLLFLKTDFPFIKKDLCRRRLIDYTQISLFFNDPSIKSLDIDYLFFHFVGGESVLAQD
jgi:hypothetical protein